MVTQLSAAVVRAGYRGSERAGNFHGSSVQYEHDRTGVNSHHTLERQRYMAENPRTAVGNG